MELFGFQCLANVFSKMNPASLSLQENNQQDLKPKINLHCQATCKASEDF